MTDPLFARVQLVYFPVRARAEALRMIFAYYKVGIAYRLGYLGFTCVILLIANYDEKKK